MSDVRGDTKLATEVDGVLKLYLLCSNESVHLWRKIVADVILYYLQHDTIISNSRGKIGEALQKLYKQKVINAPQNVAPFDLIANILKIAVANDGVIGFKQSLDKYFLEIEQNEMANDRVLQAYFTGFAFGYDNSKLGGVDIKLQAELTVRQQKVVQEQKRAEEAEAKLAKLQERLDKAEKALDEETKKASVVNSEKKAVLEQLQAQLTTTKAQLVQLTETEAQRKEKLQLRLDIAHKRFNLARAINPILYDDDFVGKTPDQIGAMSEVEFIGETSRTLNWLTNFSQKTTLIKDILFVRMLLHLFPKSESLALLQKTPKEILPWDVGGKSVAELREIKWEDINNLTTVANISALLAQPTLHGQDVIAKAQKLMAELVEQKEITPEKANYCLEKLGLKEIVDLESKMSAILLALLHYRNEYRDPESTDSKNTNQKRTPPDSDNSPSRRS